MRRLATRAELPGRTTYMLDYEVLKLQPDFKPQFATSQADEDWKKIWTFKYAGKTIMAE